MFNYLCQKKPLEVFYKKAVLKNFAIQYSQENIYVGVFFLRKLEALPY